jgi:hypothetical protein
MFFTSALVGGERSGLRPGRLTTGERALDTHLIGGWVGPRTSLDDKETRKFLTLLGLRLQRSHRTCTQSLYWLCYPDLVIDNNSRMGGVDLIDDYLTNYQSTRKRLKKNYQKHIRQLFHVYCLNSYLLLK